MPNYRRPLIGISVTTEQARWRVWSSEVHLATTGYSKHVRLAGGCPMLLPVGGDSLEARDVVSALDGLVISGGADVSPDLYDEEPHPAAGPFDAERDAWERSLLLAAIRRGIPVLGICRGMQLLNVTLGGSLIQHLPDSVGTSVHAPVVGQFETHGVATSEGSRIHDIVGATADVPTYHHQAVGRIASGLEPVAWSADGTIEAIEDSTGRLMGVQWHPEAGESNAVLAGFVGGCAQHRTAQPSAHV